MDQLGLTVRLNPFSLSPRMRTFRATEMSPLTSVQLVTSFLPAGQVFALLVLTVAAAEAAIGLAILVVYYRNRGSIAVEDINTMKG